MKHRPSISHKHPTDLGTRRQLCRGWIASVVAASFGVGFVACGGSLGKEEPAEGEALETTGQPVLIDLSARPWPNGQVSICFDPTVSIPSTSYYNEATREAKAALRGSWEAAANIKFTFYSSCTAVSPMLTLRLPAVDYWGAIGGVSPVGVGSGTAQISYCVPSLPGANCSEAVDDDGSNKSVDRLELFRATIIHEVGHSLGLRHEHQRTDTPASVATWCEAATAEGRNPGDGDFIAEAYSNNDISNYQGAYDKNSIMNYCRDQNNDHKPDGYRPWDTINDRLSKGDIAGIVALYGPHGKTRTRPQDYDGDGKNDRVVFRPSDGTWYVRPSAGGADIVIPFGVSTDKLVPGDYDGDGKTDAAVFRPSNGTWYAHPSEGGADLVVQFGVSTDVPVPGDYDGDGKSDPAVFRPSNGTWYARLSAGGADLVVQFGVSTDVPVPGDYDGDGKSDPAVFRPSNGTWYARFSSGQPDMVTNFGVSTDRPVQDDYDADGKTDVAVFRPSNGTWYAHLSAGGADLVEQFGVSSDRVIGGDYDGDGRADTAVFRPSSGNWYVRPSSGGADIVTQFGVSTDRIPYQR